MLWTEVFLWIIQTKHHTAKNYFLWLSQYFLQSYLSTVSTLYLVSWIAKKWKSGEYLFHHLYSLTSFHSLTCYKPHPALGSTLTLSSLRSSVISQWYERRGVFSSQATSPCFMTPWTTLSSSLASLISHSPYLIPTLRPIFFNFISIDSYCLFNSCLKCWCSQVSPNFITHNV